MIKKVLASFITAFIVVIVFANNNFGYVEKVSIDYSEETLRVNQKLNNFEIILPSPSPTPTEKVIERQEMLKRGNLMNEIEYVTPIFNLVEIEEEPEEEDYEEPVDLGNIFDEELAKVPYNHLQFLYDDGWTFDLTDEDFGSRYGYSVSICGLTIYRERTIYIRADEWSIHRSAIHELGHALDYEFDWASETDEFNNIFNKERYNFTDCVSIGDGHEISDVNEYWASVYQNMILDYWETYSEVPETVEYIERHLATI